MYIIEFICKRRIVEMKTTLILSILVIAGVQQCTSEVNYVSTQEIVYEIAGIFETDAIIQMRAFDECMQQATKKGLHIQPVIFLPSRTDSYSVWRELCTNKEMHPIAVVGPQSAISDGAVREQCAVANIPHIQAAWQPYDLDFEFSQEEPTTDEETSDTETDETDGTEGAEETETENIEETPTYKSISINFYPDSHEIALAYAKLLKYYRWEGFAVLYEDHYGLMRIQKILAEHTSKFPVIIRKLEPNGNNHKIFKEIKDYQESRILIDCHSDRIKRYMEVAGDLNMLNHYQHYIFMAMDTSVVSKELASYKSNFTWLSITKYDKLERSHLLETRVGSWKPRGGSPPVTEFKLEELLMDDIANHVLGAMEKVTEAVNGGNSRISSPPNVCDDEAQPWIYGALLQNHLLKLKSVGLSGNIEFDEMGRRINYVLHVSEIHLSERRTIGRWESATNDDIIVDSPATDTNSQLLSYEFRVISRTAMPYFYKNETWEEGDDETGKYMGFSVDLMEAIISNLRGENFSYTYKFIEVEDESYGKYNNETKKWTGLIGYLLDQKADLAVCDLTITEERKAVVDFSVPFMSLGISILFLNEQKETPPIFSFLNPFDFEVWMYTATAYCIVSIVLFVCARISPADWENPQPCDKDPEELENIWNFKNCTWLTMGSIMTQGCDILPKGFGTRWICGIWWFFVIIVCQTYIAQLSASMTSAMENKPITSVEDLANQNKILYGCIESGSTLAFFKNSNDKIYRTIYENMMSHPAVLAKNNKDGRERVKKGKHKYAFFMESSTIAYEMKRNCDLKKVGGELDSKDYGIAMPANSPFRTHINRAILKLKEQTTLDNIVETWWEKMNDAKNCTTVDEDDTEGDMEMENLIGLFVVLIMGLVFGIIITGFEFFDEVRNIVVREKVSHKEAFTKELRASLNFTQLQKPVLRNPSRAASLMPSEISINLDKKEKQEKRAAAIENFLDFEKQVQ